MASELFYEVSVKIKGYTPLLMHKMTVDALGAKPKGPATDYSNEWEGTAYLAPDGNTLVCPSSNLESMLTGVSTGKKIRKTPVAKLVTQMDFNEMEYPFTIGGKNLTLTDVRKNGWIDVRSVVVARNRVARARTRLPVGWELEFNIISRTGLISADYLRTLLEESGELVGLMDYRPQRKGKFGQFEVVGYKEV